MPALKAKPATFDRATQRRRGIYAKAQIAKKQLVMDEDSYRQIIFDEGNCFSLTECSDKQLDAVMNRLKGLGFKPLPKNGSGPAAQHPMARKARALWYHLGVVRYRSEKALEGFAKRQLGCDKLVWARQSDAYKLIEALKNMAVRNGWRQTDARGKQMSPIQLQCGLCEAILGKLTVAGAIPEDWSLDIAAFRLCGIETGVSAPFSVEQYADLAKSLGDKLRELAPQEPET